MNKILGMGFFIDRARLRIEDINQAHTVPNKNASLNPEDDRTKARIYVRKVSTVCFKIRFYKLTIISEGIKIMRSTFV